jgi:preprotein translocase SecE subunit
MAKARRRSGRGNRRRENSGGEDRNLPPLSQASNAETVATLRTRGNRSSNPLGFIKRIWPRFIVDIVSELRKVTWPTFSETRYLTIVVAVVAIAVGLFLGGFDLLFGWIIEKLFF